MIIFAESLVIQEFFVTPYSALQHLIIKAVRLETWSITWISGNVMKEKKILPRLFLVILPFQKASN